MRIPGRFSPRVVFGTIRPQKLGADLVVDAAFGVYARRVGVLYFAHFGDGVGYVDDLLRRIAASFCEAKQRVPELRMILVAGPRIDAASFAVRDGLEVRTIRRCRIITHPGFDREVGGT